MTGHTSPDATSTTCCTTTHKVHLCTTAGQPIMLPLCCVCILACHMFLNAEQHILTAARLSCRHSLSLLCQSSVMGYIATIKPALIPSGNRLLAAHSAHRCMHLYGNAVLGTAAGTKTCCQLPRQAAAAADSAAWTCCQQHCTTSRPIKDLPRQRHATLQQSCSSTMPHPSARLACDHVRACRSLRRGAPQPL